MTTIITVRVGTLIVNSNYVIYFTMKGAGPLLLITVEVKVIQGAVCIIIVNLHGGMFAQSLPNKVQFWP